MFCPNANASDGILDLCVVGDIPKGIVLLGLPTAFWGKHYFLKGITPYKASQVKIEASAPLWVHTDGEVTRKATSLTVSSQPNALHIISV